MPYTAKQNKLFRAAAHSPDIAKKHGMTRRVASRMAAEGAKQGAVKSTLLHAGS